MSSRRCTSGAGFGFKPGTKMMRTSVKSIGWDGNRRRGIVLELVSTTVRGE